MIWNDMDYDQMIIESWYYNKRRTELIEAKGKHKTTSYLQDPTRD